MCPPHPLLHLKEGLKICLRKLFNVVIVRWLTRGIWVFFPLPFYFATTSHKLRPQLIVVLYHRDPKLVG